jgi:hypothetical protein
MAQPKPQHKTKTESQNMSYSQNSLNTLDNPIAVSRACAFASRQLFTIKVINIKTKKELILGLKPMTHKEVCNMLSKFTPHKDLIRMAHELPALAPA